VQSPEFRIQLFPDVSARVELVLGLRIKRPGFHRVSDLRKVVRLGKQGLSVSGVCAVSGNQGKNANFKSYAPFHTAFRKLLTLKTFENSIPQKNIPQMSKLNFF
jgi:hypothetical protein